jgi:flagellar motor switch protein FliN/FliY
MNALTPGEFAHADLLGPGALGGLGALGAIEVRLSVEVGAARLTLSELTSLVPGAVFELDRRSDERIDIFVNDRLLAKGEVVTIGDRFGVRILDLVPTPPGSL